MLAQGHHGDWANGKHGGQSSMKRWEKIAQVVLAVDGLCKEVS